MTRKTVNKPRKMPRQARARATFEAIIEAAEQVLRRDGLESLTASAVAERAGVSVGSLYQYFPNKEAILQVASERRITALRRAVLRTLAENRAAAPAQTIEALLNGLVAHLRADAPTLREAMKTEAFLSSSPAMSRCLDSLTRLFVRCAQSQPEQLRVPRERVQTSVVVLTRVVWETCRETLVQDEDAFFSPHLVEELQHLTHTHLLKRGAMSEPRLHRHQSMALPEFAGVSSGFGTNSLPSFAVA